MPQLFQVLKCYKCLVFQVHQTKKSNKWECKLCGEKQSIKRHYGIGNGKECRMHVQKLNTIRGDIDELKESVELNRSSDEDLQTCTPYKEPKHTENRKRGNESKWSNFVEETELATPVETDETMYLGGSEVVLEMPGKKKKRFKPPTATVEALPDIPSNDSNVSTYNYEPIFYGSYEHKQRKRSSFEIPTVNYNTDYKNNSYKVQATTLNREVSFKEDSKPNLDSYKLSNVTNKVKENNQAENHMKVNTYVPPKVNKNSKWAEFADESENEASDEENSMENTLSTLENSVENMPNQETISANRTRNIFELCDDSELDEILNKF